MRTLQNSFILLAGEQTRPIADEVCGLLSPPINGKELFYLNSGHTWSILGKHSPPSGHGILSHTLFHTVSEKLCKKE